MLGDSVRKLGDGRVSGESSRKRRWEGALRFSFAASVCDFSLETACCPGCFRQCRETTRFEEAAFCPQSVRGCLGSGQLEE